MRPAPILVFSYNRPEKLDQVLHSLKACPEFADSAVTIFVDGPKNAANISKVKQVQNVACAHAAKNICIRTREENLGLKNSIREGVSATLEAHESVIVIEDDLVVAPGTLTYFNKALRQFSDNERVWSVSAYMYEVPQCRNRDEAFFLPFPNPWGWATWKRCWQMPELNERQVSSILASRSFRTYFDAISVRDFASILALDGRGLVDSWFIHWYLKMFIAGGLSLWPPRSMIENAGTSAGTHASRLNVHRFLKKSPLPCNFVPKIPDEVVVDFHVLDQIRDSRDARLQRLNSILGGHKRRIRSAMNSEIRR